MSRSVLSQEAPRITKEIIHSISIRASMEEVFRALTISKIVDDWGGGPARIQARVNGRYSLWDGEMYGVIKEIEFPRRLVFTLRESDWEEGFLDSLVLCTLNDLGSRTSLLLEHASLPNRKIRNIHEEGWGEYFLGPLKAYLEKKTGTV